MRKSGVLLGLALAASLALASTASAQVWSAMPTLGNTPVGTGGARAFWNNRSDDNKSPTQTIGCNIGFVLTGQATATGCANQRPDPWLPFAGTPVTQYFSADGNAAQSFLFSAGWYRFDFLPAFNLGGDIAGANVNWGYFTVGGADVTLSSSASFSNSLQINSAWGLWIDLNTPTGTGRVYSNQTAWARQFALLGYGNTGISTASGVSTLTLGNNQSVWAGYEDNACTVEGTEVCPMKSDFDNQDAIFRITAVPEPSTYALMATGLLAIVAVRRRRRVS